MFIGECDVHKIREGGARCVPAGNHRPAAGRADLEAVMKLKTNELTGAALDWMANKCSGMTRDVALSGHYTYKPSTNWAQGGPIIEREWMLIAPDPCGWEARHPGDDGDSTEAVGPTPLIAAMRCYVKSQFGDEVDVPEELSCPDPY